MKSALSIDGSYGEGGGQIVRTALALAAMTGRAVRIENIRESRPKPGLASQHLTVVRALAEIVRARVDGAEVGSRLLTFAPTSGPLAGQYRFDVSEARRARSAGSACLILQGIALPLAVAGRPSVAVIRGGTHVPWSPTYDYVDHIWRPALARAGVEMELALHSTGWYPRGGGEISARFGGAAGQGPKPSPLILTERGSLIRILAQVVTANLPEERQIAMRMFQAAREALPNMKAEVAVSIQEHRDGGTGAAILLVAEYRNWRAGFSALGRRGVPAERVGQEAAELLLAHNAGSGVLDTYLSDQILLPLSFAGGVSRFSVQQVSRHLETNAWVIEKFGVADIEIARRADCSGLVTITPAIFPRGT